jgi:hypothetical protein
MSGPERHARQISQAVLVFACTLVALSCAQLAYRIWLPTEGWAYESLDEFGANTLFFSRNLLGEPTPLRPGDQLVALDGVPYGTMDLLRSPGVSDRARPGDVVTYSVLRDGEVLDLAVPLKRWTGQAVLVQLADPGVLIGFVANWLLFGLSIFVLLRRIAEPAARALLLFVAVSLANNMNLVPDGATTQYSRVWPLTAFFNYLIWAILLTPSLLVLTLTFPRPKEFLRRWPWLLLLPYAAFWLLLAAVGPSFEVVGYGLSGAFFILSLLAVLHSVLTQRDTVSRAQLLWGFGGFLALLLTYMPFFFGVFLSIAGIDVETLGWYTLLGNTLTSLGFPLFQVMIAVAILRYRLFDIEVIIRRTLVYSVLTIALGLVYLASVIGLQALFVRLTGQESTLAVVASTLGIATLFGPLRTHVQRFIDRRFFRRRYDGGQVLSAFAGRAQREAELDTLAADVLGVVRETLEPERARLWIVMPAATEREPRSSFNG